MSLGVRWLARTTSSISFASPAKGSRSSARLLAERNTNPCNVRSREACKRKVSTVSLINILRLFVNYIIIISFNSIFFIFYFDHTSRSSVICSTSYYLLLEQRVIEHKLAIFKRVVNYFAYSSHFDVVSLLYRVVSDTSFILAENNNAQTLRSYSRR